ncbi:MAG TPA: orotidine-5'-phosphate decarboxylase [Candidatus Eisenbacteria bacterium]|nr:orotidine-5'-phosphate decarboxylase [Candidatus Eisenbacteria bacterium]
MSAILRDRLIVALDMPDLDAAAAQVDRLGDGILWYKVGLQLFCASGRSAVETIAGRGKKIFLDLKLHDIPATVEKAIRALDGLPVSLLTVHASGGPKMLEAAASAARSIDSRPTVLGVTVLTSLDGNELPGVWDPGTDLEGKVLALARLCADAGVGGVVASPRELSALRREHAAPFRIVTPGIRGPEDRAHDQKRTLSIGEAFALGADHIVVGRPLLEASDPKAVLASYEAAAGLHSSSERMIG